MTYFKKNLPLWERGLHLTAGVIFALTAYLLLDVKELRILAFATSAILVGTAILGYCSMKTIITSLLRRQKNAPHQ